MQLIEPTFVKPELLNFLHTNQIINRFMMSVNAVLDGDAEYEWFSYNVGITGNLKNYMKFHSDDKEGCDFVFKCFVRHIGGEHPFNKNLSEFKKEVANNTVYKNFNRLRYIRSIFSIESFSIQKLITEERDAESYYKGMMIFDVWARHKSSVIWHYIENNNLIKEYARDSYLLGLGYSRKEVRDAKEFALLISRPMYYDNDFEYSTLKNWRIVEWHKDGVKKTKKSNTKTRYARMYLQNNKVLTVTWSADELPPKDLNWIGESHTYTEK